MKNITAKFLLSQGFNLRLPQRFWSKVNKDSNSHGCWLWTGLKKNGYGVLSRGRSASRTGLEYTHRISWILHFGSIPKGLNVLHNCPGGDNSICVNPNHLWLGSKHENSRDMVNKDRSCFGEHHGQHRLTWDEITVIRASYIPRIITQEMLGHKFGVSRECIRDIVRYRRWNHGTSQ